MAMNPKTGMKDLVTAGILIAFGVILVPVINSVITTANLTDSTQALIVSILPLLFLFGLALRSLDIL